MFHKSVKYVPSWFPGAEFKRFAAKGHVVTTKTVNKPFNEVKRRMVRFRSFPIIVGVRWATISCRRKEPPGGPFALCSYKTKIAMTVPKTASSGLRLDYLLVNMNHLYM